MRSNTRRNTESDSDADGEEKDIPTFEGQVVFQGDYEPIESEADSDDDE